MTRKRVAIVGGGFSGAVLAAQLVARGRAAPDVTVIETRGRLGRGLAYSTKESAHLLNVRAGNMSAFPDKPDHFVRWLAKQGLRDTETRFVPRSYYGAYAEALVRQAPRLWGPKLEHVRGSVTSCSRASERWALSISTGRSIAADAVVLAIGNLPPAMPGFFRHADAPLISPWDERALRRIPAGDVLLLGTGLTAVDVALSLARMRRKGLIYALSRRGRLPQPHLLNAAPPVPHALDLPGELSAALFVLRKEAVAGAARGEPWQHVIDRLRSRTTELWQRLSGEQQLRFLRHVRPWWDSHRHRMAPEISARISALQAEGRLRILAGEIVSAERSGKVIHLHHRQRGSFVRHHLEVAGVVNCTGAAMDLAASDDPLIRQLIHDGVARAHYSGIAFDVDADGRVIDANGAPQASLYALGPVTQGVFWESTAVPEIRVRAATLAARLASA